MISANIDKKLRKSIYAREGYECALCGDNRSLQIHHYIPRSQGGKNSPHNLICLCWRCHALAHGHSPYYEIPTMTQADAEQGIVEYLADYYAGHWNPKEEEG